jgi:hypothetical protein
MVVLMFPGGLRHRAEELGGRLVDAILAALDACRGDEDGVFTVVGDDLFEVLGSQRLCVVAEDPGASHRCHGPPPLPTSAATPTD